METVSVNTVQVTKIARLLVLLADCESRLKMQNVAEQKEGAAHEVLAQAADVIKGINIRAYMPTLRADRAICLLCSCAKDIGTGKMLFTVIRILSVVMIIHTSSIMCDIYICICGYMYLQKHLLCKDITVRFIYVRVHAHTLIHRLCH